MSQSLAAQLHGAVGEDRVHTAVVVRGVYQPVGGAGSTVMPPTYPIGEKESVEKKYAVHHRLVDGGEPVPVVTVDQEPSQANRVEEALLRARDRERLAYPLFEMRCKSAQGEVRLTSLDFPHRYADAYLRDSLVEGKRFDESEVGQLLRSTTSTDVRPLYERDPGSLVFGAWDSHRKGRWPKFARLYTAFMFGVDPHFVDRRGGRLDPRNLTGAVDDKAKAESDWKFVPAGEKTKGQRLSEIGHGNIAPSRVPGGVTVREVHRQATVSFAGLERLRFGDASPEGEQAARAALAALALAGDRLAFGKPSVWLRSGCDLVKVSELVGLEKAGGEVDAMDVSVEEALAAFHELREQAAEFGVAMSSETVAVEPVPQLAKAIEYAVSQAVDDDGE
ncbi:hypothetical protein GCM10012287_56400 [Streptomyces daqingensis]|uniref:Type I-U CRISPR-associated protein Cas7 n=1 Tax=Streptomyces daqingensis TaxID=1472640 RepID=A0ABQ2MU58_9ACTN|nr:type I-U CRISPR-associated RAMP protein Csb1/Cas7u [Streptomyces daqingensis]GGO58377.1 hypothetical protein GCM10012287_56400 [Streptomyces daqingensis]